MWFLQCRQANSAAVQFISVTYYNIQLGQTNAIKLRVIEFCQSQSAQHKKADSIKVLHHSLLISGSHKGCPAFLLLAEPNCLWFFAAPLLESSYYVYTEFLSLSGILLQLHDLMCLWTQMSLPISPFPFMYFCVFVLFLRVFALLSNCFQELDAVADFFFFSS